MLSIEFSGWFQCRLATDPDPYRHPTGVSGWTFVFPDEPDLDRIIRFHDPVAPRSHGPTVGVVVHAVRENGRELAGHPLLGARVELLGSAVFEGRNGIIAPSAEEPIVPFHLRVSAGRIVLERSDPLDLSDRSDLRRRQPHTFEQNSMPAAEATGIVDYQAHRRARAGLLRLDLAAETDPLRRLNLEGRIAQLEESDSSPGDIRNSSLGFRLDYAHELRGPAVTEDPDAQLGGTVISTGPWSVSYWMGAWDADALCGYVRGELVVPFRIEPVAGELSSPPSGLERVESSEPPLRVASGPPPLAETTEALVSQVEFERSRGMQWVLELHPGASLESLRRRLRDRLGDRCEVEALFEPAPDEPALDRFAVVKLPGVRARDLEEGPFEWAYRLVDSIPEARRVEPDTPFAFMPPEGEIGLESTSGGCTVPEHNVPPDARWALKIARVDRAWTREPPSGGARFGEGILIGHPDTGWAEHQELESGALDLTRARDFVSSGATQARDPLEAGVLLHPGHGTATGSVLVSRNAFGMTGVAPAATLVPLRCAKSVIIVFNATDVARAIQHAANVGCHVISISLGGPPRASLTAAVNFAVSRNVIVAAAAGNCVQFVTAPATVESCIACAASTHLDGTWPGSCRGPAVTISAPGQFVYCARREPANPATTMVHPSQGTSFAVTHVAGTAALWLAYHGRDALLARYADGTRLQSVFKELLRQTARRPAGWDAGNYGAGILDADALLAAPLPDGTHDGLEALESVHPGPQAPLERMLGRAAARRMLAETFGTTDPARLSAVADRFGTELAERLLRDRSAVVTNESLEAMEAVNAVPGPRLERCSHSLRRAAGRGRA